MARKKPTMFGRPCSPFPSTPKASVAAAAAAGAVAAVAGAATSAADADVVAVCGRGYTRPVVAAWQYRSRWPCGPLRCRRRERGRHGGSHAAHEGVAHRGLSDSIAWLSCLPFACASNPARYTQVLKDEHSFEQPPSMQLLELQAARHRWPWSLAQTTRGRHLQRTWPHMIRRR